MAKDFAWNPDKDRVLSERHGMLIENERHPSIAAAYAHPLVCGSDGNGSQGPDGETLDGYIEVKMRLSPCEMKSARALARERGTSCEALVSNVVGMYLDGMLLDRERPGAAAVGARGVSDGAARSR